MSTAPTGWQNPKTNWASADVPTPSDFNRIENNINAIETGNRTLDPAQSPTGNTGTLRQILNWIVNRIKAITGTTNWWDAPVKSISQLNTDINAALAAAQAAQSTADAALPKSAGSANPLTGDLEFNKASAHIKGLIDYMMVSAKTEAYLASNAYWDGTRWNRHDTSQGAAVIVPLRDGTFEVRWVGPGANPITWAQQSKIVTSAGGQTISGSITLGGNLTISGNIQKDSGHVGFLTTGGQAQDIKAKSIVLSTSFSNNAPANGIYSQGDINYKGTILPQLRNNGGVLEFYDGGTWKPVGGIKSVQRGIATVAQVGTLNVAISSVNMSKAFVNISQTQKSNGDGYKIRARLTSATNLELYRWNPDMGGTSDTLVAWEVIESY